MTPRFTAVLVSLFLLSLTMLFGPLLLVGCDPGPAMKCDYCRTERYKVQRYICDKCKTPHAACDAERSILNYTKNEGLRGAIYYSSTSIMTCPAPPDGSEPVITPAAEITPATISNLPLSDKIIAGVIMVALFFIGYARGRMDRPKDKRVC